MRSLERIAAEAAVEWPGARLAIAHRVGSLQIGDASVVIAAASPHRADAFAACRYAIERIKQIVPIGSTSTSMAAKPGSRARYGGSGRRGGEADRARARQK